MTTVDIHVGMHQYHYFTACTNSEYSAPIQSITLTDQYTLKTISFRSLY